MTLYRAATRVERIEQDDDSVTAILADGTRESGALLIAADGIHSTIRAQLAPDVTPRYAGYVAWRGVIEESEMTAAEHALLFGRMCFALPEGELLLALGMPGRDADTRPGHRRYYWIWFRPADEANALPALCTDATGRCHGSSIPPHLVRAEVDLRSARKRRRRASRRRSPPSSAARASLIRMAFSISKRRALLSAALCCSAIRLSSPGRMSAPASPKRRSMPQGLVEALAAEPDLAAALARYDRERHAFGSALVARARHLGAYLEARSEAARRDRAAAGNRAARIRHGREDRRTIVVGAFFFEPPRHQGSSPRRH